MAIIYYPRNSFIAKLDSNVSNYEQLLIAVNPNTIFYFDTGSVINAISASVIMITASWANTASFALNGGAGGSSTSSSWASSSLSSSYSTTASFSLSSGDSQTPWKTDINAAGHTLSNINTITGLNGGAGAPGEFGLIINTLDASPGNHGWGIDIETGDGNGSSKSGGDIRITTGCPGDNSSNAGGIYINTCPYTASSAAINVDANGGTINIGGVSTNSTNIDSHNGDLSIGNNTSGNVNIGSGNNLQLNASQDVTMASSAGNVSVTGGGPGDSITIGDTGGTTVNILAGGDGNGQTLNLGDPSLTGGTINLYNIATVNSTPVIADGPHTTGGITITTKGGLIISIT